MTALPVVVAAALPPTVEVSLPVVLAVAGAAALLAVVGGGLALALRRLRRREIRELTAAAEELRAGRAPRKIDLEPRSPLAPAGEALSRLAQDLSLRWAEAEGSGRTLGVLTETLRDRAVVVTDPDGDVRSVSPGGAALFGWEPDALRGRPAAALFDDGSWRDLLPKLTRRDLRDVGVDTAALVRRRDGSPAPVQVSFRMLRRPGAEVSGMLLVFRDAQMEQRLEEELRRSESRYARLVEGLGEGVAIVRDGAVVYANPAWVALLEIDPSQVEGLRLLDRIDASDVLVVRDALAQAESGAAGAAFRFPATLRGKGGERAAVVRMSVRSVEHGGRPAALVSMFDETAERRAEAELRRNEARLDAVLESASDGFAVLADGPSGAVVRMANARFGALLGLRATEILGAGEGDLLRAVSARGAAGARLAAFLAGAARSARRETFEFEGPGGKVLDVSVLPLVDGEGEVTGRLLAARDVSAEHAEHRRLEGDAEELRSGKADLEAAYALLAKVHDDARQRGDDLERLNAELKTLDRMKSELLANVSHELQQPLVAIRGYTEMTLKGRLGPINEEQRKGLTLSLRNIDRLIALIDELLTFARAERGRDRLHPTDFALAPLLDEAQDLLAERIRERGVEFRRVLEPGDLGARADRDKILQVFVNLLSNAVKYNREGGAVEVIARKGRPGYLEVEVKDTGVGIPREDLERIFDPFERGSESTTAREEGTGVGLSIVRNILRRHGCSIEVKSREGEGTRFTFSLPATGSEVSPGEDAPEGPAEPSRPSPPRRPWESSPRPTRRAERPGLRIIRRSPPDA